MNDEETGKAKLYVRGSDESMRNLIHFEKGSSQYESALNFNKINGLKSFVFASKEISADDASLFQLEFISAKRTNLDQELKLYNLAKKLETNLDFEAIVGFENSLKEGAEAAVDLFRRQGLNIHILSGDNLDHCLQTAQQLKLIGDGIDSGYHHLEFSSEDIGRGQIKRVLDMICKSVVKQNIQTNSAMLIISQASNAADQLPQESSNLPLSNQINLVVSGKTVDFINGNKYLREHFMFILNFTKTLVGYDFSPVNKAQLVSLFKSLDRKTSAIGDGYNDILMLKTADVGIQIASENVGFLFGDIIVNDLLPISKSLNICRDWNHNLSMMIHSLFIYTTIMSLADLIFQAFVHFSGDSIFTSYYVVFSFVGAIPICLYFIFSDKHVPERTRNQFPGFYCEKNYLNKLLDIRIITYHIVNCSNIGSGSIPHSPGHHVAKHLLCRQQH